jgi:uncharacterized protein YbjT (DUF2867 family)
MTERFTNGPVLVTGATGPHGGAVAAALLAAGRRVRALTRDPASAQAGKLAALGAELATGDLLEPGSLRNAMRGAAAVYAVTTPFGDGPQAEIRQGEQIIAAAAEADVPWLVLASVASADRATGVPHFEGKWQIEQRLRTSRRPHTVVAPTYFYENLGDLDDRIAAGELALPLPASRPLQQLALADLGAAVASMLDRREEFLGQRIELAADQPTPRQMADALSVAGGRAVSYRQVDIEEVVARSEDLAAMYRFLADTGYQVDIDNALARFPDVQWTTFAEWVIAGAGARPGTRARRLS